MSSPTVTIFDPQGVARDIPYDMLHQAVAAKGVPAVRMQAPDGSIRLIPADKMAEAVQAKGKVLPLEQQEVQHPGFWSALGSDLKGMLSLPSGVSPYPGMDVEAKQAALAQGQQQNQSRQAAGYSAPYRALAPFAQGVGVNVPGMEQSAAQGDAAGVMGHAAAVPAVIAAGEAIPKAAPPVIRGTVKAANKVIEKAPALVTGAIGAGIGEQVAGSAGAQIGAGVGAYLGKDLLKGVKIPGENFGIKSPSMAVGPVEYMGAADALKMKRTDPQAFFLRQQQIAKYGMQDRPRGGMPMTGQTREIDPNYQPPATPEAAPAPDAQITASARVLQTKAQPKPPTDPAVLAKQAEALRGTTNDTVSQALPDASKSQQMRTQAEVDFYLRKGNVEKAQVALDKASGRAPTRAENSTLAADRLETRAIEDQVRAQAEGLDNQVLEQDASERLNSRLPRKAARAKVVSEFEARQQFIKQNAPSEKAAPSGDLTDILQQSLDQATKRKGQR